MKKVLVVASHSAGHILPAVAFCQGLLDKNKEIEVNFISTEGKIERMLLKDDFKTTYFNKEKITLWTSYKLAGLFFNSISILKKINPDLVVGFGGYLSVPFIINAYFKKIPNFIHEQNVKLGTANKFLLNFSKKIILSFPNNKINKKIKNKCLILGLPLRKEVQNIDKKQARDFFDLFSETFTLLVMGGSQGSHKINTQIVEVLKDKEFSNVQVIHITGWQDYDLVREEYRKINIEYRVYNFLSQMHYAFSACDLAICRAGANTIAEIAALKIPSILIPYPYAKHHQLDNAQFLSQKNAAILIKDKDCNKEILKEKIIDLKNNPDRLRLMVQALAKADTLNARNRITDFAFEIAQQ